MFPATEVDLVQMMSYRWILGQKNWMLLFLMIGRQSLFPNLTVRDCLLLGVGGQD